MPNEKNIPAPDKGKDIGHSPSNEPIIKSDVPDFEYTPPPPPTPDSGDGDSSKE